MFRHRLVSSLLVAGLTAEVLSGCGSPDYAVDDPSLSVSVFDSAGPNTIVQLTTDRNDGEANSTYLRCAADMLLVNDRRDGVSSFYDALPSEFCAWDDVRTAAVISAVGASASQVRYLP